MRICTREVALSNIGTKAAKRPRFAAVTIFAAILLLSSSLPSLKALGAANATPPCAELCWTITAPPSYTLYAREYDSAVTYHNGFDSSVQGTVYLVMRNQLGQAVAIDPTTATITSGGTGTLHPSIIGRLFPPGNYSTHFFAINAAGVAISNETVGSLESTYKVFLNQTSTSFGQTGPINFMKETITSVSPYPLVVNVTIIASDPQSNETVGRNQTEITIPAMSTGVVPPMLVGTGNLRPCKVSVTMFMQDPNGANLAPPAGLSQECGPT